MKKVYLLVIVSVLALTLAGCETIKGMGRDITTVGGWLTRGSENVQNRDSGK